MEREEYVYIRDTNEQEIAHWQARTDETEQLALELAMCVEAVDKINRLWQMGSDEDKQGLARSLFTDVLYNLDARRIVGFKLKPWADRFLVLRTALYAQDEGQKKSAYSGSRHVYGYAPYGLMEPETLQA